MTRVLVVGGGPVGLAASRKLARSVFFKGLAAAVGEALEAAARMGPEAEAALRADITQTLTEADASTVDRLQEGSRLHAVRREEEMAAAADIARSKTSGTPAVRLRGLDRFVQAEDGQGCFPQLRKPEDDLFR